MNEKNPDNVTFSFVVPVCNGREGLEQFHRLLTAAADLLDERYEVIYANDAASDEAAAALRRIASNDIRVRVIELSRRFGRQTAITAGYDYAVGRAVISLAPDGDQPVDAIGDLVARWREGFEVVYGVRNNGSRRRGGLLKRAVRRACGADLAAESDFRLLDRRVVEVLRRMGEHTRLISALVHWTGFRQTAVPYAPQKPLAPKPRVSPARRVATISTGVFNFSLTPLRIATVFAGSLLALTVLYAIVALGLWPFGMAPGGWANLTAGLVAVFAAQLLFLGLLGEYIGRVFVEAKARPLYVVRETLGFPERGQEEVDQAPLTEREPRERFSVFT